jgi:hypothetical protein
VTLRARAAWLAGYVITTFLSFPHPVGGIVLDLGRFVSWLGPACLLLGLPSPWASPHTPRCSTGSTS